MIRFKKNNGSLVYSLKVLFFFFLLSPDLLQKSEHSSVAGVANALSSSTANNAATSRLTNTDCTLELSIGRIPGTAMPAEWAASGAKLGLRLDVEFTGEPCDYEYSKERVLSNSDSPSTSNSWLRMVRPLTSPTFVSREGQQEVPVSRGAYGCSLQQVEAQLYSFRFCLDFPEGATRNDVVLPAERIFFLSYCWIESPRILERAQQQYEQINHSLEDTRLQLSELEEKQASANVLQKAMGIRKSVLLVEQKKKRESQLAALEQTYPLPSVNAQRFVQGPNGTLLAKEGILAVKRFRGALDTKEQYHWVGTFSVQEFSNKTDEDE